VTLAVDLGSLTLKIASDDGVTTVSAPDGGPRARIRAALAGVRPRGGCCVAVPDAWLTADVADAGLLEDVRYECEDVAGSGPMTWTGQLASVAALVAKERGDGRYLVCDVGGSSVRAGVLGVSDGTVEIGTVHTADGAGWRDFDASIRSRSGAGLPAAWYTQAAEQERRAADVFGDAVAFPADYADTRVYRITGRDGPVDLTARNVIESFAPTLDRIRAALVAVTTAGLPDGGVVVTGSLSWLPLATRLISDFAGAEPVRVGLDAAARGAYLFAQGEARLADPLRQPVSVPAHGIRNGLLEEFSVILPWTAPFGAPPDGPLLIDRDQLELKVGGKTWSAPLRGLVPGPHRIGVRPTWPGSGVLVVRPVTGDNVHVVPLAALTAL
jgi:hypothetical protein